MSLFYSSCFLCIDVWAVTLPAGDPPGVAGCKSKSPSGAFPMIKSCGASAEQHRGEKQLKLLGWLAGQGAWRTSLHTHRNKKPFCSPKGRGDEGRSKATAQILAGLLQRTTFRVHLHLTAIFLPYFPSGAIGKHIDDLNNKLLSWTTLV